MTESTKAALDEWRRLASKELKGADPDSLTWHTLEGIEVKPLYTEADAKGLDHLGSLPGIEASTGSLGQGLSIGLGMALAARLDGSDARVFVLLGDGECQEGQVWEAAMAAGHHRPANLIAIVDYNKFQLDGAIEDIIGLEPLAAKWESMGWTTREVDGHDIEQVMDALRWARTQDGPACIIAHTIKGKGVSFMEGDNAYHGVAPSDEELPRALAELEDPESRMAEALGDDEVLEQAEQSINGSANGKGGAQ